MTPQLQSRSASRHDSNRRTGTTRSLPALRAGALAVALAFGAAVLPAHAVLERVGPLNASPSVGAFPAWYQDTTGLAFEFCDPKNPSEVQGGWCLLLPGDVTVPEVFPVNFFDEHFWYAADAGLTTVNGGKATLVLAVEAAFAADVAPGGQIAFSRIRVKMTNVPVSGSYRFIHPYGEEVIEAVAGQVIFFTDDVGINCAPGQFHCAMDGRFGPFLLPSSTPGGAEMPPLTAENPTPDADPAHFGGTFTPTPYPGTGKAYIADPSRTGPVTGSPLPNFIDSTGTSRNHNIFRIEGPPGSGLGVDPATGALVDYVETTDFSLMGRLYTDPMPGQIEVTRVSYDRKGDGQKLRVFASATKTSQGRTPGQPRPPSAFPTLAFYDAPCSSALDLNGFPVPPYGPPFGRSEINMQASDGLYWGQTSGSSIPSAICLKDASAADINGNVTPLYTPHVVGDQVSISDASFDPATGTLTVKAHSSDDIQPPTLTLSYGKFRGDLVGGQIVVPNVIAPPGKVRVISSRSGVGERDVDIGTPSNLPPVAGADSATTRQDRPVTISVLSNDSDPDGNPLILTTVSAVVPEGAGTVAANTNNTVTFVPNATYAGVASFNYGVSDGAGGTATGTVSVTVTQAPVNRAPVANADTANTGSNTAVTINVLANDSDPDGDALVVAAVTQSTKGSVVINPGGTSVKFTPAAGATGTATFTYTASDGRGGLASAPVNVNIQSIDALATAQAQYLLSTREWRVNGLGSVNGATITLHAGATLAAPVIGTATVTLGKWTFRQVGSAIAPDASRTISLESSAGGKRLAIPLTITN